MTIQKQKTQSTRVTFSVGNLRNLERFWIVSQKQTADKHENCDLLTH